MFENPRRGSQARSFSENDPKILDLKSSSEQIIFRKLSLGSPVNYHLSKGRELVSAEFEQPTSRSTGPGNSFPAPPFQMAREKQYKAIYQYFVPS